MVLTCIRSVLGLNMGPTTTPCVNLFSFLFNALTIHLRTVTSSRLRPNFRSLFVSKLLSNMVVADMQGNSFRASGGGARSEFTDIIEGESWDNTGGVEKQKSQKDDDLS